MEFVVITLLRLLIPVSILRWPLLGILASSLIDLQDYYYLRDSNFDMAYYQAWDKIMDIYYLSFAAYTSLAWKEIFAKRLAIGSYFIRLAGVIVETTFGFRGALFIFPNFFESFFVFYLIYKRFRNEDLFINSKVTAIVISALLIPKLLQELSMHVLITPPTFIFDLSKLPTVGQYFPRPPEAWAQIIFFFALPLIVLIWRLWETQPIKTKKSYARKSTDS